VLAEIFWITDKLAIMPHLRGGDWLEGEIESLKNQGVSVIVSLLEREEVVEFELQNEESLCVKQGVAFLSFPIPDKQTPDSIHDVQIFTNQLKDFLQQNQKVAIHCRQGVGRSALIAACVMVLQNMPVADVFRQIEQARACHVPDTEEQMTWFHSFAENLP
jgi:protein-tyrosine phosphatase